MSPVKQPWTRDDIERLRALCADPAAYSGPYIAALMGRTRSSVANKIQEMKRDGEHIATDPLRRGVLVRPVASYREPSGRPLAEAFAPMESADEPDDAFLSRYVAESDRHIAKARTQRHARLRIAAGCPVALSLSSDWHVGKGSDLQGLIRYTDWLGHTPNVYGLLVGDQMDNPIKHRGGNISGVKDELRMYDLLLGRARGKILGKTSGNHDDWTKTLAGIDNLKAMADRHRIHYAPDELLWTVEIVDPVEPEHVTATYRIYTRHQWRRGSSLNPGHACWTWWQEEGPNWEHRPDVLAIAHNHQAVVEQRSFDDMPPVWALRMGAWQVDSDFARAKGFGRYRPTAPTVVLCPHRSRDVQAFADYREAETYMRGVGNGRAA